MAPLVLGTLLPERLSDKALSARKKRLNLSAEGMNRFYPAGGIHFSDGTKASLGKIMEAEFKQGWTVKIWHEAGEAIAYWDVPIRKKRKRAIPAEILDQREEVRRKIREMAADENQARAGRRAKGVARRYATANGLDRLWTFTYAEGRFNRHSVVKDIRDLFEGMRVEYGNIPLLVVPEPHPGGHGLHLHMLAGRFLDYERVKGIWGKGIIHGKRFRDRKGRSAVAKAASYAAKYVSKEMHVTKIDWKSGEAHAEPIERPKGCHRYYVTQGFQPEVRVHKKISASERERVLERAAIGNVYRYDSEKEGDGAFSFLKWEPVQPELIQVVNGKYSFKRKGRKRVQIGFQTEIGGCVGSGSC